MANSLVFNYIDAAKKQSLDKALAFIDAIRDVSVIAYDDENIRQELADVSTFAHEIHIPEYVGELVNDAEYLVPDDVSSFVTKDELEAKGYLTDHQSLDAYAKTADINIYLSNLDASVQDAIDVVKDDVSTSLAQVRSDLETGMQNVEQYTDDKVLALNNELSATIAANKTSASNDLEYAITRVRGDIDASLGAMNVAKQDAFAVGTGLALEDGVLSSTIDTTLFRIVDELPVNDIEDNKIYLVATHNSTVGDIYTEHIHTDGGWEKLGEFKATTDLSGYYTKNEVDNSILTTRQSLETIISTNKSDSDLQFLEISGQISALQTEDTKLNTAINTKTSANATAIQELSGTVSDHKVITDTNTESISALDASLNEAVAKEAQDYATLSSLISNIGGDNVSVVQHLDALDASVVAEIAARQSGDTAEATARQEAISAEATARQEADATEIAARQSGDTAEATARQEAINTLSDSVSTKNAEIDGKFEVVDSSIAANTTAIEANTTAIEANAAEIATIKTTLSGIPKLHPVIVEELPSDLEADPNVIYLVRSSDKYQNEYTEYIFINGEFESLGSHKFEISNYATIAYVDGKVSDLNTADAELEAAISTANGNITANASLIAANQTNINTLNSTVAGFSSTISSHEDRISNNETSISTINGSITENASSIGTLESSVDSLRTDLSSVSSNYESLSGSVSSIGQRLGDAEASITGFSTSISGIDASIVALNGDIDTAVERIAGVEGTIVNLNTKDATHDSSISALEGTVSGHTSSLTIQDSRITNLETAKEVIDSSIAAINTDIANLDSSFATSLSSLDSSIAAGLSDLDASIVEINTNIETIDSGLTNINTNIEALDASVVALDANITEGLSVLDASIVEINSSIEALDASVVEGLSVLDASIVNINSNIENIDASIEALDASVSGIASDIEDLKTNILAGDLGNMEEEYNTFDYIKDEASWNESVANGAMKKYYEKYPEEDLYNEVENRAATFNDRQYATLIFSDTEGTTQVGTADFKAGWVSTTVQKITNLNDNSVFYIAKDAAVDDTVYEMFTDNTMTTSASQYLKITEVSYPGCVHSWQGIVNAPGAKLPWICPYFTEDVNAKIKFMYKEKSVVMPWGDRIFGTGEGHKTYGWASVAEEFQDNGFLIPENQNNGDPSWDGTPGDNNFNLSNFKIVIVKQDTPNTVKSYIDSKFDTLLFLLSKKN